jgi:predicted acylesterase/phospholipase RssA
MDTNQTASSSIPSSPPIPLGLTFDFDEIKRKESAAIHERRNVHRADKADELPANSETPDDLIGLALSGGGIRAASVGLGAIQALRDANFLKDVDYMSTVSGGGYVGAYLTSAAISSQSAVDKMLGAKNESGDSRSPGHSALVKRFIFGGKYLYRPWEAANKYLIGLFMNNLLLFSGLIAFAAGVAWVWRWFDKERVRDFLDLLYLGTDFGAAFAPFMIVFVIWLLAWLGSYIFRNAEAPGGIAQWVFILAAASLLIGITIVLVNPETTLGDIGRFFGQSKLDNNGVLTKCLLGLIAACLTPFLAPKRLVKIAMGPPSFWQQALVRLSVVALTIGLPLLVVGVMSMRNISNTADNPTSDLRYTDIRNWPAFIGTLETISNTLNDSKFDDAISHGVSASDLAWLKAASPTVGADQSKPSSLRSELSALRSDLKYDRSGPPGLAKDVAVLRERDEKVDDWNFFERAWKLLEWRITGQPNDLIRDWDTKVSLDQRKVKFCQTLNDRILPSRLLPFAIAFRHKTLKDSDSTPLEATRSYLAAFEGLRESLRRIDPDIFVKNPTLPEAISEAEMQYQSKVWKPEEAKDFSLAIMRAIHPENFFSEGKAYWDVVIEGDQRVRGRTFLIAFSIFIMASLSINLNTTSMHRFYRNRLKHAFIIPRAIGFVPWALWRRPSRLSLILWKTLRYLRLWDKDRALDVQLSELDTTKNGAPYHLINAAIDLNRPRVLDEIDREAARLGKDRRETQAFLFSRFFCGSDATGWLASNSYETFRKDNINFADALALSGAALDPLRSTSIGLKIAMWALNLNLGQWMPNPRYKKPLVFPNCLQLLRDRMRRVALTTYCYVSDGGFTDNLGIMSLLRRGCRLIVAVDASCDSNGAFSDLNAVIRNARIRFGIEILQPAGQDVLSTKCLEPDEEGICQRHFALARIRYPKKDAPDSWLVYLKPSFTGDEGADLMKYKLEDPEFPNDSTANQFYEPAKIESYRRLGFHIAESFCKEVKTDPGKALLEGMADLSSTLAREEEERIIDAKISRDAIPTVLAELQTLNDGLQSAMAGGQLQEGAANWKTGDQAPTGLFEFACEVNGHKGKKVLVKGMKFPPCPVCGGAASWRSLRL